MWLRVVNPQRLFVVEKLVLKFNTSFLQQNDLYELTTLAYEFKRLFIVKKLNAKAGFKTFLLIQIGLIFNWYEEIQLLRM